MLHRVFKIMCKWIIYNINTVWLKEILSTINALKARAAHTEHGADTRNAGRIAQWLTLSFHTDLQNAIWKKPHTKRLKFKQRQVEPTNWHRWWECKSPLRQSWQVLGSYWTVSVRPEHRPTPEDQETRILHTHPKKQTHVPKKTWVRWDAHTVSNAMYSFQGNTTGHWEGIGPSDAAAPMNLTSLTLGRRSQGKKKAKWSPFYNPPFHFPNQESRPSARSGHLWEMCGGAYRGERGAYQACNAVL